MAVLILGLGVSACDYSPPKAPITGELTVAKLQDGRFRRYADSTLRWDGVSPIGDMPFTFPIQRPTATAPSPVPIALVFRIMPEHGSHRLSRKRLASGAVVARIAMLDPSKPDAKPNAEDLTIGYWWVYAKEGTDSLYSQFVAWDENDVPSFSSLDAIRYREHEIKEWPYALARWQPYHGEEDRSGAVVLGRDSTTYPDSAYNVAGSAFLWFSCMSKGCCSGWNSELRTRVTELGERIHASVAGRAERDTVGTSGVGASPAPSGAPAQRD